MAPTVHYHGQWMAAYFATCSIISQSAATSEIVNKASSLLVNTISSTRPLSFYFFHRPNRCCYHSRLGLWSVSVVALAHFVLANDDMQSM